MEENPTVTGEFTARYTIERELGRGGAAVVYLARDNRQERHVALKVLHKELAQAIGAQRFLREIKHSSALQHPHLLTILDSGESRGTLYFVMPYMADGSLRTRIAREKQLPIDEALRITKDVGEALAYAHSKGIVHRDIKPDNVLFSADHACLADFGIARAVDSVAADTLTSTGLVVGTPAYMSPEQASGEKTVDARSDQYSLGCLLYEMITGLPPFIGATQQSVISQRFTQPPPSMRVHRPNVPDHVERAVKRALAVVPADRFPTVKEFVEALYARSTDLPPPPASVHRIRRRWFAVGAAAAIVVFAVMAANPGTDWVRSAFGTKVDTSKFVVLPFLSEADPAQGGVVAAGLHSALSRWEGLPLEGDLAVQNVIAQRREKISSPNDAIAVAKKLGVGRLIWGRVTTERGATRIVANLYDASSGASLVERSTTTDSVFTDATFRDLANSLLLVKPLPRRDDDGLRGTRSFPAWQAYTRALAALGAWRLDVAEGELKAAVDADPEFAIAQLRYAQLLSWKSPQESDWVLYARRAVALRSELRESDAQRAEALLGFGLREYHTACPRYREIVRQDTLDAISWFSLGGCLRSDPVVVRDPRSRSRWSFRTSWHEAGQSFIRAFEIDPGLHAIPRFDWVTTVFTADRNRIRPGKKSVDDSVEFAARPSLVADTLAYTPYPFPDWEREKDRLSRDRFAAAVSRNGEILLDITSSWARTSPPSAEAFSALAAVRENRDELTGSDAFAGALQALNRAKELATSKADSLAIGEAQVRVRVKLGMYSAASALADTVLRGLGAPTAANWRSVARLAGLTGRAAMFESALEYFWAKHADIEGVDQTVGRAGAQLLARSALGMCGPALESTKESVSRMIQTRVRPESRPAVSRGVLSHGLSYMVFCTNGMSMASATRDDSPITRAQIAFARGNRSAARAILDTLEGDRSFMRPGDMALNLSVRHAALRLHMGDTASAVGLLDTTLDAIPTLSASVFGAHPLEPVMLVRAMIMRASLPPSTRSADTARKWSGVVLKLWSKADPSLKPTLARMERLSQIGVFRSR